MPQPPLQILLITGSAERPSRVRTTLDLLEQELQSEDVITFLWDLHEQPLPLLDLCSNPGQPSSKIELIRRFISLADQADAFIWGSPIYHNSFSGILKNALDYLSPEQVRNKPVALVSNGNNDRTGSQPCDQLRIVARGLLGVAIPTQLITLRADFARTPVGFLLIDEAIRERIKRLAEELLTYVKLMRPLHRSLVDMELSAVSASATNAHRM
jgi:azobenzene reductase